jgi:hypothetical protein
MCSARSRLPLGRNPSSAKTCTKRYNRRIGQSQSNDRDLLALDEITEANERVADCKVRFRAVITTSN